MKRDDEGNGAARRTALRSKFQRRDCRIIDVHVKRRVPGND